MAAATEIDTALAWLLLLLLGCHGTGSTGDGETCVPVPALAGEAVTTLARTVLAGPRLETPLDVDPAFPDGLRAAIDVGLGVSSEGPGEPRILRDDLAPGYGGDGPDRRSLLLFLHTSDAHVVDAESPIRVAGLDGVGQSESAARPQDLYAIHALDALIRTADRVGELVPVDFALATGDDADNAQMNETTWFRDVWDGVPVRPDSGDDDHQVGPDCRDPLAPFVPRGADFPWYTVAGNHDVLVQGNFPPDRYAEDALHTAAPLGTRDLREPGGPLTFRSAAADTRRAVQYRSDIASLFLDSPAVPGPVGHGFTEQDVTDGSVNWSARPVPDVPVRIIAMDMNPPGSADGFLSAAERDGWLIPQLDAAEAAGELVIVTGHYTFGGRAMEGGGTAEQVLLRYPNVVAVVCGHSHVNAIRAYGTPGDPHAFWQIQTSSGIDWPGEGRFVELIDNGDGTLSIDTTMLDFDAPAGSLAARARELSLVDWQSGWRRDSGPGRPDDCNTELVERLPDGWEGGPGLAGARSDALP